MFFLASNIKFLRKGMGLTQKELSEFVEVKPSSIGAYEEDRAEPKLSTLLKFCDIFKVDLDDLISNDLQNIQGNKDPYKRKFAGDNLRVLSITVDRGNRENIEFVPVQAEAGYLAGYKDPEFIEDLVKFTLPFLTNGTYRAFEIKGDSMLPIMPGSIIIGEYVENWYDIKDGQTYIFVTRRDGIVFKRAYKIDDRENIITLSSDNSIYSSFNIDLKDVMEVWKTTLYVSEDMQEPNLSLQKLSKIVMDLQQEIIKLKGN